MATKCVIDMLKGRTSLTYILKSDVKLLHTTAPSWKVTSGRVKVTQRKTKPVTYEVFLKPHDIGRRKSWNSWNTSTIEGGPRPAETLFDDVFIRKFIVGTFHDMVYSEVQGLHLMKDRETRLNMSAPTNDHYLLLIQENPMKKTMETLTMDGAATPSPKPTEPGWWSGSGRANGTPKEGFYPGFPFSDWEREQKT